MKSVAAVLASCIAVAVAFPAASHNTAREVYAAAHNSIEVVEPRSWCPG